MRTFISAIIEEPTTTPKSTHHIKGIITPIVTAIVPYSEHFYLPFLAEKNNDREINNEEEFKHYLYQSSLKMLDFLSESDHACNHENSSDTRPKTRPRTDA
ncbi:hypothetical protein [Xenorhabdus siamensis]|uniref:hypothetical protein n=1 Tax=Xenorhabdus siamensis TaxID=3136254 RepID=UPI0030F3DD31